MPDCFFDMIALGKHYHPEVGPHFQILRNSSSADSPQPTTFERSTPSSSAVAWSLHGQGLVNQLVWRICSFCSIAAGDGVNATTRKWRRSSHQKVRVQNRTGQKKGRTRPNPPRRPPPSPSLSAARQHRQAEGSPDAAWEGTLNRRYSPMAEATRASSSMRAGRFISSHHPDPPCNETHQRPTLTSNVFKKPPPDRPRFVYCPLRPERAERRHQPLV